VPAELVPAIRPRCSIANTSREVEQDDDERTRAEVHDLRRTQRLGHEQGERHHTEQDDAQRSGEHVIGARDGVQWLPPAQRVQQEEQGEIEDGTAEHVADRDVRRIGDRDRRDPGDELGQRSDRGGQDEADRGPRPSCGLGDGLGRPNEPAARHGNHAEARGEHGPRDSTREVQGLSSANPTCARDASRRSAADCGLRNPGEGASRREPADAGLSR
jgi:hypothetical protein